MALWATSTRTTSKYLYVLSCVETRASRGISKRLVWQECSRISLKFTNKSYLIHPVGVEHPQTTKLTSSSLLSNRPLVPLELELGDTLVLGLAIDNTLRHRPLPATTPDTDAVNNITLKTSNRVLTVKMQQKTTAEEKKHPSS
jgi:hypothetical protein